MKEKIRRCPKCGRELMLDDVQCGYCGAELKMSRRPIGKWLLIPVLLLVIALGAYLVVENIMFRLPEPDVGTLTQEDAMEDAREYLETGPFSQVKLQRWLEYDGYSPEQAAYAAEHCGADWDQQALASAEQLLEDWGHSLQGLQEDLEYYEDFTPEQAQWAVSQLKDVDWQEQALRKALSYLDTMPMSRSQLLDQLIFEGFSQEDAEYGVAHCGADWQQQALRAAREYGGLLVSRKDVQGYLERNGYTPEEIEFALENM